MTKVGVFFGDQSKKEAMREGLESTEELVQNLGRSLTNLIAFKKGDEGERFHQDQTLKKRWARFFGTGSSLKRRRCAKA